MRYLHYFLLCLVAFLVLLIFEGQLWRVFRGKATIPPEGLFYPDFKVIAHRGASGDAPENTLAAFQLALEQRADWIELDVHMSKDGEVIVMHDYQVDRTTNGSGRIEDMTLSEIGQLDAGYWFDEKYENQIVPTLEDVLRLVRGRAVLLIEIKWPERGIYEGLGKKVYEIIDKYRAQNWTRIQSFELDYLEEFRELNETVPIHRLKVGDIYPFPFWMDRNIRIGYLVRSSRYEAVNPYYKTLSPRKVKNLRSRGNECHPYTVDNLDEVIWLARIGANGVITNHPGKVKELVNKHPLKYDMRTEL